MMTSSLILLTVIATAIESEPPPLSATTLNEYEGLVPKPELAPSERTPEVELIVNNAASVPVRLNVGIGSPVAV